MVAFALGWGSWSSGSREGARIRVEVRQAGSSLEVGLHDHAGRGSHLLRPRASVHRVHEVNVASRKGIIRQNT